MSQQAAVHGSPACQLPQPTPGRLFMSKVRPSDARLMLNVSATFLAVEGAAVISTDSTSAPPGTVPLRVQAHSMSSSARACC